MSSIEMTEDVVRVAVIRLRPRLLAMRQVLKLIPRKVVLRIES